MENLVTGIENKNQLTLRDIVNKFKRVFFYLRSKKIKILFSFLIGGFVGLFFAFTSSPKYISKITFVIEESKGMSGGLSAIAGQFGLDLGGGSGGGILSGDNILLFFKSEQLSRETLLTYYDDAKKNTLADRYAEVLKLKQKWSRNKKIGNISFSKYSNSTLPRLEDSLLQILVKRYMLKSDLIVQRIDKKSSFIEVRVSTMDEKLSYLFSQRVVKIAIDKYIDSKTKLKSANVNTLQKRADSLAFILNNKTYRAASSQQLLVDANPAIKGIPINAEISLREKSMTATIFAEVVKNLEIAKSILSQETPVIQFVDMSTLPLDIIDTNKVSAFLLWAFFFGFTYTCYLVLIRWVKVNL
jgi:hypothetical protein